MIKTCVCDTFEETNDHISFGIAYPNQYIRLYKHHYYYVWGISCLRAFATRTRKVRIICDMCVCVCCAIVSDVRVCMRVGVPQGVFIFK